MAQPNNIIQHPEGEWWKDWEQRIRMRGRPVKGVVRFTFLRVLDINEKDQDFSAQVRVDCSINVNDQLNVQPRRIPLSDGTRSNYVVPSVVERDAFVEEFAPKLLFANLKRSQFPVSKWVRRTDDHNLTFSMEVSG